MPGIIPARVKPSRRDFAEWAYESMVIVLMTITNKDELV
jgi:hypothetical protein